MLVMKLTQPSTETYRMQNDSSCYDMTDMHGQSLGTLLSLAKLRLNVLHVVSHPLQPLLTLHQLSAEQRAPLHLQQGEKAKTSLPYKSPETKCHKVKILYSMGKQSQMKKYIYKNDHIVSHALRP